MAGIAEVKNLSPLTRQHAPDLPGVKFPPPHPLLKIGLGAVRDWKTCAKMQNYFWKAGASFSTLFPWLNLWM
jgi:hypothetical protein